MTTSKISAINHLSTVLEQLVEAVKGIKTGEPVDAYTKAEIDQKLAELQAAIATDYYTKSQIDDLLSQYRRITQLVDLFYVRGTIDGMLAGKADVGHEHQPQGVPLSIKSGHDASLKSAVPFSSFAGQRNVRNMVSGSTLEVSPTILSGIDADGAHFEASRNDYVIVGNVIRKQATIVIYGNWNRSPNGDGVIATDWKQENGANPVDARLLLTPSNVHTWHNSAFDSSQPMPPSAVTTRVVIVFDGTTRKTYVDGLAPLTATVSDRDGTSQGFGLMLGGYWRSVTVVDGVTVQNFVQRSTCTIKEVLHYDRALSPSEFPSLYDRSIYNF